MGGSAREWSVELPEALAAGGDYDVELILTNIGTESVTLAFDVVVLAG